MRLELKLLLLRRGSCLTRQLIAEVEEGDPRRLPSEICQLIAAMFTCQDEGGIPATEVWRNLYFPISVAEVAT